MKRVIWKNQDLLEPICFDENGNALDQYDPEYDTEPDADIIVCENGYAYARLPHREFLQDGYCMRDQDFTDYVDSLHQPVNY